MSDLVRLQHEGLEEIASADTLDVLERVRLRLLGRKGLVQMMMQELAMLEPEERKSFGQSVNKLKDALTLSLEERRSVLSAIDLYRRLETERLDVTLPARPVASGRLHPISQTIDEVIEIFGGMGFIFAEGPDIESDFNNFTALNFPPWHPAREMQDTFYLPSDGKEQMLLRTHTSPVQVRSMQTISPPIRIIAPGRTYRSDSDQTHSPMFHQVEGLLIEEATHMGHLKGCLTTFIHTYFENKAIPLRFRPSFFPFTEPSAEVDIGCDRRGGELRLGEGSDWLEVLGSGMVHPNVLRTCGLDPQRYQGFAFGMGIERIAMLKYGIPDLRTFYDADQRWLDHYGFNPFDVPSLITGLGR